MKAQMKKEEVVEKAPLKEVVPKAEVPVKHHAKEPEPAWANPFATMRNWMEEMERTMAEFGFMNRFASTFFPTDYFRPAYRAFREMPLWNEFTDLATRWSPQAEITRRENDLLVRFDLPGVKKEDITVEIDDHRLHVHGERKHDFEEKKEGFYRSERSYGAFERWIPLPDDAKIDKAEAVFNDGVLEITMEIPKAKGKGKKLAIK